jgi:hypothetical protein
MRPKSVRDRCSDMWTIMRGRAPRYRSPYSDPADEGDDSGPEEDEACVPVGPRRPSDAAIFRSAVTETTVTCRNPASHGFTHRRDGSFVVF